MATKDPLDFLARGIITPFRRDKKQDFANDSGLEVIRSNVRTILNTTAASRVTQGEIPFNQKLGCHIQFLKHKNLDDETFEELAIYYIIKAFRENEPRVRVKDVRLKKNRKENKASLVVKYDIIEAVGSGVSVIAPGQEEQVKV